MGAIDIGPGATDRTLFIGWAKCTILSYANVANASGVLDTFEIYANTTISNCKIGTFSGSSVSWANRDYETIGTVNTGSKQTFTGKNCDVSSNDRLGIIYTSGQIEGDMTGTVCYYSGDAFAGGTKTYSEVATTEISIYATGETAGGGPTPAIKVGGVWKETTSQKIKVGGAWKAISNIKVKVSGVWK